MTSYLTNKITMGLASVILLSGISLSASAATVVSGKLSQADANQLESWLGQGPIDLTNIWSGTTGALASDWHNAVDGAGPTLSIYDVTHEGNDYLVGGYTITDWADTSGFNPDSEAFIFNLTTGIKEIPEQHDHVQYAVVSHLMYFASFGAGHAFHGGYGIVGNGGYADPSSSFGSYSDGNIINGTISRVHFQINGLETYTVLSAVPEPRVVAMMGLGLGLVGFMSLRRRKSEAAA